MISYSISAKSSSIIQLKTKLDMFLANNIAEEVCDFKVKGCCLERSCVVYAGESSTIVAQVNKDYSLYHSSRSKVCMHTYFVMVIFTEFVFFCLMIVDADA